MKKVLVAAGVLGALAFGAAPALAHDQVVGGCGFSANSPPNSNNTFTGEIDITAHARDAANAPVAGTTWDCDLQVNGTTVATLSATSNAAGIAANAAPISYTRNPGDTVVMCETITHSDGHQTSSCTGATSVEIPPAVVRDLIWQATAIPDPIICPVLASNAGTYGPVVIDGEGDVWVDGVKEWDCPPYDV